MADAFLVEIDLAKLQNHFAEAGERMPFGEIEAWLEEMGFVRQESGWVAEDTSLDALATGEYRILKRL